MTDDEIESVRVAIASGVTLQWNGRHLKSFSPSYDEEPVAFIDGGKPGDYIALWNVDLDELSVVTPFALNAPHLDGGARAQDASEALREARVQGMREGFDMAHGFTSHEGMRDAERALAEAIEAVRKGER